MDSDIKYEFEKIINLIEEIKRMPLREIKEKLNDLDLREIKSALAEIKSRLDSLESRLQK